MSRYVVEPKSRMDLRKIARDIRKTFHLEKTLWIPIVEMLDVFSDIFDNFSYEIVEDEKMDKGVHAETNIQTGEILIKESIYEGACRGNGRDRMTIAHELGHFITICLYGFHLYRNFEDSDKIYTDPEWQAKCFAGEFMIDYSLTKGMSDEEIAKKCGVSIEAAKYQSVHQENMKEGD